MSAGKPMNGEREGNKPVSQCWRLEGGYGEGTGRQLSANERPFTRRFTHTGTRCRTTLHALSHAPLFSLRCRSALTRGGLPLVWRPMRPQTAAAQPLTIPCISHTPFTYMSHTWRLHATLHCGPLQIIIQSENLYDERSSRPHKTVITSTILTHPERPLYSSYHGAITRIISTLSIYTHYYHRNEMYKGY